MKSFFTLLFLFQYLLCFSQKENKAQKKLILQAQDAFDRNDFLNAFRLYGDILKNDTSNHEAFFKSGVCLFSINKTDTNSIRYFLKSKNHIPESHYYIGRMYLLQNAPRAAIEEFYQYKKFITEESLVDGAEVQSYIKMCENAIKDESKNNGYAVKNIGSLINTAGSEYVPLIWSVNGSLFFTSRRENSKGGLKDPYGRYYEDIYVSSKSGSGWANPIPLSDNINTETHDACVAFSNDGKQLILYRTDEKKTAGDLYISYYNNGVWTVPEKLGTEINSEYLEASACFGPTGNEIIFSSNRPGGFGGKDLYIVKKFLNGKYSLPRNLGPEINTAEDEDAPFVDHQNNSLYFSSRGHNTIGEYDIFISEFDENTERWKSPENLGLPINSTTDDIFFIKTPEHNFGYFTSRRQGGFGDADIYEINFNENNFNTVYCSFGFNSKIPKSEMQDLVLTLFDTETNKIEGIYRPNKEYITMILYVNTMKNYKLLIEGKKIEPIIKTIKFEPNNNEITFNLEIKSTK